MGLYSMHFRCYLYYLLFYYHFSMKNTFILLIFYLWLFHAQYMLPVLILHSIFTFLWTNTFTCDYSLLSFFYEQIIIFFLSSTCDYSMHNTWYLYLSNILLLFFFEQILLLVIIPCTLHFTSTYILFHYHLSINKYF